MAAPRRIPQRGAPKHAWDSWNTEKVCEIGMGGQGKCWLVRQVGDCELAVVKSTSNEWSRKTNKIKPAEESRILGQILPYSERIVEYYMATVDPIETHLYLEYCDGGDLQTLIDIYRRAQIYIPEAFIWHTFAQITEAISWIHYGVSESQPEPPTDWERVIHRDIKPANIFLKRMGFAGILYPAIKLGDFGLAAVTNDQDHTSDFRGGTFQWQPPERPDATAKGDVWSAGAIIHALAHGGKSPLAPLPSSWSQNHYNRRRWRQHPQARQPTQLPGKYTMFLEDWMLTTLRINPAERISSFGLFKEFLPKAKRFIATSWRPLETWNAVMRQDARRQAKAAKSEYSLSMSIISSLPISNYVEYLV